LFVDDEEMVVDPASWEKLTKVEQAPAILDAVIGFVSECAWTDAIDVRPPIDALGCKPGRVMHVVYTAVEGRSAGLPLFPSIALLGRDSTLRRLRAARERL
jgi:glutamyl-tRNA synthetase